MTPKPSTYLLLLRYSSVAHIKRLCTVPVVYQEPNLTNHQIDVKLELIAD